MLTLTVPEFEIFDEEKQEFINGKPYTLLLEHSLVSVEKWEAFYKKSFLSVGARTDDEIRYYVKCMTLTQNVPDNAYMGLNKDLMKKITDYIEDPMTATTFTDSRQGNRKQIITSELIYYWMIAYNIPPEYRKWHLNRLLTLIRVCDIKNRPNKKMSKSSILKSNADLNRERRAKLNTKG